MVNIHKVKGWEVTKKLGNKQGLKVSCMKDYVKPSIRENNPDHIFHVGTNDVPSEKTPQLSHNQ